VTAGVEAEAGVLAVGGSRGALVWIDAREAVIVRWDGTAARIERLASDVPPHHRATGHVRSDPLTRGGNSGDRAGAAERRRIEHLDRFVAAVADRIGEEETLVLVGHGTTYERLERTLRNRDAAARRSRSLQARRADRPTDRQLVAELRAHLGVSPRRQRPAI